MKATVLKYEVIFRKEGKYFVAQVPTLGISDFGETIEAAKRNVQGAIECHIAGLVKTKTSVPFPDTTEYYISHAEVQAPIAIKFAY
ncbi:MAG: type II toxin-antitoxin system HicB family antitoxin [Candidatus Amesbacteria bacterium]|nr:type II toxin-antitoxin system HicB family antitoxin [Candidatus Amesbacteria bacterium]